MPEPIQENVWSADRALSQDQITVLRRATPEELEFLTMYARSYVNGKKFLCWGARAIVALGMLAGALAGILAFFNMLPRSQ
jgi:hypothetical protein